jgi:hypothetical protein
MPVKVKTAVESRECAFYRMGQVIIPKSRAALKYVLVSVAHLQDSIGRQPQQFV